MTILGAAGSAIFVEGSELGYGRLRGILGMHSISEFVV